MARRFDLVVFDWDGTLLDSPAAIVHCIQSACRDLGIDPPADQVARQVIGLGLADALGTALPALERCDYPRLAERYRHHYMACDHGLQLFDGARAMLDGLQGRGHRLAVATGKTRLGLDRAMEYAALAAHFEVTRCADECGSKPNPAMLLELMAATGVTAERTLMIGDTSHDLQMARNADVSSVGVTFGAHQRDTLMALQPLVCVDSIEALDEWLTRNA